MYVWSYDMAWFNDMHDLNYDMAWLNDICDLMTWHGLMIGVIFLHMAWSNMVGIV